MKCFCVKLIRKRVGAFWTDSIDHECRLFSSKEMAEEWLMRNGFVLGQRWFLKYALGEKEWVHKDDMHLEYLAVDITEMNVDAPEDSKFKNIKKERRGWLAEYVKNVYGEEGVPWLK